MSTLFCAYQYIDEPYEEDDLALDPAFNEAIARCTGATLRGVRAAARRACMSGWWPCSSE
jgi:hypothetical protein